MTPNLTPGDRMAGSAKKAIDAALDQARSQRVGAKSTPDPKPAAPAPAADPAPPSPRTIR